MTIFIFLVTIFQNPGHTPHFKLFHSPAFAPPAELNQASKMLCWEIPSPLEENPTHTYAPGCVHTKSMFPYRLWVIVGIVLMSSFLWHRQSLCLLSLSFIIFLGSCGHDWFSSLFSLDSFCKNIALITWSLRSCLFSWANFSFSCSSMLVFSLSD